MWNARLDEAQAGIKIAQTGIKIGRNINNLRYTDDTTLMAKSEGGLKSLLMKVKEESEKAGLKLKTKIMASGPITSWQVDGKTMETVRDFIFLGSKILEDGDCSQEIKRCLLLGRKVMIKLDSILTGRDITLLTKVRLVKAMVFPMVMYGCESWTIKKAECWRIDVFELQYWRRLLSVPWTARISNQFSRKSVLNIHWKDWCWNWNFNTLAIWCKELTHWKRLWCWERLKAGEEGDDRGWCGWMASLTQWACVWAGSRSWWWTGKTGVLQSIGLQRVRHDWVTELKRLLWWLSSKIIHLQMQERQVWFLGWEDALEKEMATHSSILAWKISWICSLVGNSPWGCKESNMT